MTQTKKRSINERLPLDPLTNAQTNIGYEHHEIHGGSHFLISGFETEADSGTIKLGITTPAGLKQAHVTFEVEGTSQTEFRMYEDPTYTSGTPLTPINNNRNSSKTSILTVVKDPTVSDAGDLILIQSKGKAGTTPNRADLTANARREREIILKSDSKYLFEITSKDDDNIITFVGEWYEHSDKS